MKGSACSANDTECVSYVILRGSRHLILVFMNYVHVYSNYETNSQYKTGIFMIDYDDC